MFNISPVHKLDGYKTGHREQYPAGTEMILSNMTARSAKHTNLPEEPKGVVFFGLQSMVIEFLINDWNANFFNKPKDKVVSRYARRLNNYLGSEQDVSHIEELHDLGYLPVHIRALPEGTIVPIKVPMWSIHNTKKEFFWITNYLETILSAYSWRMNTSATTSKYYYDLFNEFAEKTCDNKDHLPFQAHDFSYRGMDPESAVRSAAAHLLSFAGTDSIPAIDHLEEYYNADSDNELVGASIPATEHSVMCAGGVDNEIETFKRLITEVYPHGMVSIVSDTWDFWKVIDEFLPQLKNEIIARDTGSGFDRIVIRPDSGKPADIICGDLDYIDAGEVDEDFELKGVIADVVSQYMNDNTPHGEYGGNFKGIIKYGDDFYNVQAEIFWDRHDKQYYFFEDIENLNFEKIEDFTSQQKGLIERLWEIFGGTTNSKGYKVLNPLIGAIYGDSITPTLAKEIMQRLEAKGFASSNIVLGVGSYTFAYVTRDTYGHAIKATHAIINGEDRMIFKDPKTDDGTKKSLRGMFEIRKNDAGELYVVDQLDSKTYNPDTDLMEDVFIDGQLIRSHTLSEIRDRLKSN